MYNKSAWFNFLEALMANPFVQYTDGLMGIWFDYYVNLWLQFYYSPSFIAGDIDSWVPSSNLCKPN